MKLSRLFIVNFVFNILGGFILIIFASKLDSWLGLSHNSDFIWHLLGICSLSLAALSFYAASFKDKTSIKAAVVTFMLFNGLAVVVSVWAISDGLRPIVWLNTGVHLVFLVLFLVYGRKAEVI